MTLEITPYIYIGRPEKTNVCREAAFERYHNVEQ